MKEKDHVTNVVRRPAHIENREQFLEDEKGC